MKCCDKCGFGSVTPSYEKKKILNVVLKTTLIKSNYFFAFTLPLTMLVI